MKLNKHQMQTGQPTCQILHCSGPAHQNCHIENKILNTISLGLAHLHHTIQDAPMTTDCPPPMSSSKQKLV